jgi:hypothetical protein
VITAKIQKRRRARTGTSWRMRPDGRTSSETKLKVARKTTIVIKVASVKGGLVIVAHLPKSDDRFT